jgi:hypothetical protein
VTTTVAPTTTTLVDLGTLLLARPPRLWFSPVPDVTGPFTLDGYIKTRTSTTIAVC